MVLKSKTLAKIYLRNESGHIIFPDDVSLRRDLFLEKVFHPSHNNLFMLDELAVYLVPEHGWICDPMAGTGSSMYLARRNFQIHLVELGLYFADLIVKNRQGFEGKDNIHFEQGDCTKILNGRIPNLYDLVMFSPPYADQLQVRSGHAVYEKEGTKYGAGIENFTYQHPANLGNMKQFMFNRAMREVYNACYRVTKPGGFLCIIIKDQAKEGLRVGYGVLHTKIAHNVGYKLYEWHQREAIGKIFGYFNIQRGIRQITDEHMIIMQKEV